MRPLIIVVFLFVFLLAMAQIDPLEELEAKMEAMAKEREQAKTALRNLGNSFNNVDKGKRGIELSLGAMARAGVAIGNKFDFKENQCYKIMGVKASTARRYRIDFEIFLASNPMSAEQIRQLINGDIEIMNSELKAQSETINTQLKLADNTDWKSAMAAQLKQKELKRQLASAKANEAKEKKRQQQNQAINNLQSTTKIVKKVAKDSDDINMVSISKALECVAKEIGVADVKTPTTDEFKTLSEKSKFTFEMTKNVCILFVFLISPNRYRFGK